MKLTGKQRLEIAKLVLLECRELEIKEMESLIEVSYAEEENYTVEILDCGVTANHLLNAMTSLSSYSLKDIEIEETTEKEYSEDPTAYGNITKY